MKYFQFIFICSILFTGNSQAGNYVENFGAKGWLSDRFDFQDRVESFMGNEGFCNESTKGEMDEVVAKMERVTLANPESLQYVKNFDVMVEEFTFLETAKRVEDFTSCQVQSFQKIYENKNELDTLVRNSFDEFKRLELILR